MAAGLTVTEAWPVQTEARGRVNALEAAALSDSVFFVARKRQKSGIGQYEADVRPEIERIARERVTTLWADGKGIGGADLLMAGVGAGLRAYTQYSRVEYANGEPVPAEVFIREVEGVVLDTMLDQVFGIPKAGVSAVDALTSFYVLWRFTYKESSIEAGEAFVFCYPQGIELDGPSGIAGPVPALVEKEKGKFRARNFMERGEDEELGVAIDGDRPPLVDILHRVIWLAENRPSELTSYLRQERPNLEQLRLVAQALSAPVLQRKGMGDKSTAELSALTKLTANWRAVMEGAALSTEIQEKTTGKKRLL